MIDCELFSHNLFATTPAPLSHSVNLTFGLNNMSGSGRVRISTHEARLQLWYMSLRYSHKHTNKLAMYFSPSSERKVLMV